jgi:hypothetical protein
MLHTVVPYAVRLPLAFFLGVSAIVRPVKEARLALRLHQSSFEEPFPVHCASRSIWRKSSTTSDPKNALCGCGETYWVAAIASTSQLSPNPSRRVCIGVVSSGPWTWFEKSSCCALCVQLCVHQYQLVKSIFLFFYFFNSSLFQDLIAAGENIQEASLRLQISMNCFPVSKTLPTSYRCALKRPNSRS